MPQKSIFTHYWALFHAIYGEAEHAFPFGVYKIFSQINNYSLAQFYKSHSHIPSIRASAYTFPVIIIVTNIKHSNAARDSNNSYQFLLVRA